MSIANYSGVEQKRSQHATSKGQLTLGEQLSILLDHENGLSLAEIGLIHSTDQCSVRKVLDLSTQILKPASSPATRSTLPLQDKL